MSVKQAVKDKKEAEEASTRQVLLLFNYSQADLELVEQAYRVIDF